MPEEKTPTAVDEAKIRLKELQEKNKDPRTAAVPSSPEEKDIRPVTKKPKKKKFRQKLREAMFAEDIGSGSVTEYVFFKVMIPATKRVLSDMANTAINMALGLDPKTRTIGASHTANASTYRDRNFARTAAENQQRYSGREAISDLIWDEETAADIYTQIQDILDRYPSISLSNVYSIMGMPEKIRTTDKYWGWTSMRGIDMVCVDNVDKLYRIEMPAVRPIN